MGLNYELTGQRFGRWTVLSYNPGTKTRAASWTCKCDCGAIGNVPSDRLRSGRSKSCGCLHNELFGKSRKTHGGTEERLYAVWTSIKTRCNNPNEKCYHRYGGRGIKMCQEWRDYDNFRKWALSAGYDEKAPFGKCTIDRIDPDKDYSPKNCRWVTILEQENNRTNNHLITFNGETKTVAEWSRKTGINYGTLISRINKFGWSIEDALTIKTDSIKPPTENFAK